MPGRAVLAPGDRLIAVEHERGVGDPLVGEPPLEGGAVVVGLHRAVGVAVEGGAVAAAPHAVVLLGERQPGRERRRRQRLDDVVAHEHIMRPTAVGAREAQRWREGSIR